MSTFTNTTKNSSTVLNTDKNSASFSNGVVKQQSGLLLTEDDDYLVTENNEYLSLGEFSIINLAKS